MIVVHTFKWTRHSF